MKQRRCVSHRRTAGHAVRKLHRARTVIVLCVAIAIPGCGKQQRSDTATQPVGKAIPEVVPTRENKPAPHRVAIRPQEGRWHGEGEKAVVGFSVGEGGKKVGGFAVAMTSPSMGRRSQVSDPDTYEVKDGKFSVRPREGAVVACWIRGEFTSVTEANGTLAIETGTYSVVGMGRDGRPITKAELIEDEWHARWGAAAEAEGAPAGKDADQPGEGKASARPVGPELDERRARGKLSLAKSYAASGRTEQAITTAESLIVQFPKTQAAGEARRWLLQWRQKSTEGGD